MTAASTLSILIACQGEGWDYVPSLARRYGTGIEVGDVADPDLLDGDWGGLWRELGPLLAQVPGERTLHGPRGGFNPGLRDRGAQAFFGARYRRALDAAAEIGASSVVFHSGFNPLIRVPGFEQRWVRRSAAFWRSLAEEAAPRGLGITIENVWEPQPEVLRDLIAAIDAPNVGACFDVGHANIYSRRPPADWLSCLGSTVRYMHLHNNDGRMDRHLPLEEGTVDFSQFLPALVLSPQPPRLVLEVSGGPHQVEDSLFYVRRLLGLG